VLCGAARRGCCQCANRLPLCMLRPITTAPTSAAIWVTPAVHERESQELITTPLSEEPMDPRVRSALHKENEPSTEVRLMLKRTLAGLAFMLAVTALNSSPASAFGWCGWGWGYGASDSPRAYSYAPRTYYRPRARFYGPAYHGRTYYRPGIRVYRRAYYGRPFVGRAYRPAVARGFYRSGVRVSGPRARAFYRPAVRSFGTGDRARFRGRLP
jgi:hypothetical protein